MTVDLKKRSALYCEYCIGENICHHSFGALPKRGDLQVGVLLCDFDGVTGETRAQMLHGQKGVVEVERRDLVGHLGVVSAAGVAVAQDDIVEPVGDDALGVHQVPDGLQHGLRGDRENKPTGGVGVGGFVVSDSMRPRASADD